MKSNRIRRRWLLGMLSYLTITLTILLANTGILAQTSAQTLTQQGFAQFDRGDATSALKLWRSASEAYRKQKNSDGIIGNAVNQSLALQALGQFPQMCQVLAKEGLNISDRLCFRHLQSTSTQSIPDALTTIQLSPVRLLALQHLGTALQLIGDLPNAKLALQTVLNRVEPAGRSAAQLALGNVDRAIFVQLRDRFGRSDALESIGNGVIVLKFQADAVLNAYDQAAQSESIRPKAQINQLSFLSDLNRWLLTQKNNDLPEIRQLNQTVTQRLATLLPVVLKTNFATFSPIDSIYTRLNLANSLIYLTQTGRLKELPTAEQLSNEALTTAQSLSNSRATSYSLGILGRIEQQRGDLARARSRFNQAMGLAQSIRASDAAYEWQQALAEVSKQQGDPKSALAYYRAAIDSLDQIRTDLLPIAPDVQFSFRDQVEPIYRNYMTLLFDQGSTSLPQVIKTYERLRVAELENFLQCGRLPLVSLSERRPNAVVFHVLNLNSKTIGVIAQSPNRPPQYYSANADTVKNAINSLAFNLQSVPINKSELPDEATLKGYSQTLYQQLIAPAERTGLIPPKTPLVFVLDNTLQSIPLSLLHNGQTYLVNQHPVRLSLGSELDTKPSTENKRPTALIAALSQTSPSFSDPRLSRSLTPLNNVGTEVEAIKSTVSSTQLLNQRFTLSRLEDQIQRNSYDIVHIATHGQFSSTPDETFVMAWDQLITAPQLSVLLKSRAGSAIDLLVLSACQTAKGDTRSALGLAGVAVQSGARSTLASLWLIDDAATTMLIKLFYENLRQGHSKSESLQLAQIKMQQTAYANPYFWSSFVLVGDA